MNRHALPVFILIFCSGYKILYYNIFQINIIYLLSAVRKASNVSTEQLENLQGLPVVVSLVKELEGAITNWSFGEQELPVPSWTAFKLQNGKLTCTCVDITVTSI